MYYNIIIYFLSFIIGFCICQKYNNINHAPDSNIIRKIKYYDKNNNYYVLKPYLIK